MSIAALCSAIATRNLVSFYYTGDDAPGPRLVEPHMVAYTTADNLALSAWFLGGVSESQEGQGWRDYLLESMSNVVMVPQKFAGPRHGYNRTGGKKFHNVQCAL
jgi:hypothetical protein